MNLSTLQVSEAEGIITITLNRPERRNALNPLLIGELTTLLADLSERCSGVVILTGSGKAFCAGLDLDQIQTLANHSPLQQREDSHRIARLFRTLYDLPLPTIAAVNGHAIAGGMGLATICDFTLAVPHAQFGYTEARIGFIPAIVSSFLILQIGEKKARDLLLTARLIAANEANELGLVNEVLEAPDLMIRARALAQQLLQNSPESLRAIKRLLSHQSKERLDRELAAAVDWNAKARETEDFREGIASFLAKRAPVWP
ncbi:MAG TPA: enoyl-CoA hydratase-related protein, partial [Acidobacteriaceae bacterium]|nr:enoyl-CoA hydratase-related protein [Acidobacteriaceae bacterium]